MALQHTYSGDTFAALSKTFLIACFNERSARISGPDESPFHVVSIFISGRDVFQSSNNSVTK